MSWSWLMCLCSLSVAPHSRSRVRSAVFQLWCLQEDLPGHPKTFQLVTDIQRVVVAPQRLPGRA